MTSLSFPSVDSNWRVPRGILLHDSRSGLLLLWHAMSFYIPECFWMAFSVVFLICVCCLLMVSPWLWKLLVLHSCFCGALNCSQPFSVWSKKKGDHLMCVWLCLIKLMGETSGEGQTMRGWTWKHHGHFHKTQTICYRFRFKHSAELFLIFLTAFESPFSASQSGDICRWK